MGRAAARHLTEEGPKVCVADINGDAAETIAEEIDGMATTVGDAGIAGVGIFCDFELLTKHAVVGFIRAIGETPGPGPGGYKGVGLLSDAGTR
jgi:hypothetical protein